MIQNIKRLFRKLTLAFVVLVVLATYFYIKI